MSQRNDTGYSDIYDGEVYKASSDLLSVCNNLNISFTLNYDGVPKFKSSNTQIWPVQLSINELPPSVRYIHCQIIIIIWIMDI